MTDPDDTVPPRDKPVRAHSTAQSLPLPWKAASPVRPTRERRDTTHVDDKSLVERIHARDEAARAEFCARLSCVPAMIRAHHRRMKGNLTEDELADAIQDALASIWSKLGTYRGHASLESWAYGFCVKQIFKAFASKRRMQGTTPVPDLAAPKSRTSRLEYAEIHETLESLGPPGSDIIRLKHFHGLTFDEIAEELAIPKNTAKTLHYRGLAKLRGQLRHNWGEES